MQWKVCVMMLLMAAIMLIAANTVRAVEVDASASAHAAVSAEIDRLEHEALMEVNAATVAEADAKAAVDATLGAALEAQQQIDADIAELMEGESEEELQADAEVDEAVAAQLDAATDAESEIESESELEALAEMEAESELASEWDSLAAEEHALMEMTAQEEGGEGGAAGGNPTYVLPYPPVLPGHYTPLFNPYTNVNPLSTPFANYAAQPGGHPAVASAAAAQAGALAAVNSHVAGAAGSYPYYPFARHPVVAAQLAGNPVPFVPTAAWVHPQNMNSAAVGENAELSSGFPAFVEVATEEAMLTACNNCEFN